MVAQAAERKILQLRLEQLRTDGGTQIRVAVNRDAIGQWAALLEDWQDGQPCPLPPVVAFHDGKDFWLADGFHRLHAHLEAAVQTIAVDVREGSKRDAILYAIGANAEHGVVRSRDDRWNAVATLLADAEWSTWSIRAIAETARVGRTFVGTVKAEMERQEAERQERAGARGSQATKPKTAKRKHLRAGKTIVQDVAPTPDLVRCRRDLERARKLFEEGRDLVATWGAKRTAKTAERTIDSLQVAYRLAERTLDALAADRERLC